MRWIGREVKRFLAESHIHLPFLLRVAAAPPDLVEDVADVNGEGEIELEEDDDLNVTAEELAAEEREEPDMMKAAGYWDNFLSLVHEMNEPWVAPEDGITEYRKGRAVKAFNAGLSLPASNTATHHPCSRHRLMSLTPTSPPHVAHSCAPGCKVANDLYTLNSEMKAWVLHVLCFVVPRQMVELGDPVRRSCDACESLGSTLKKIIRHLTCRRRASKELTVNYRQSGPKKGSTWKSTFTRGYIEQTFKRAVVRAELIHGKDNQPYLQRADARLLDKGRSTASRLVKGAAASHSITEAMEAPWVFSQEAAFAVWS